MGQPSGNGASQEVNGFRHTEGILLHQTIIPRGLAVEQGKAPGMGDVAILQAVFDGAIVNVVLSADDAISHGEDLVKLGRRLRTGLHIPGSGEIGTLNGS